MRRRTTRAAAAAAALVATLFGVAFGVDVGLAPAPVLAQSADDPFPDAEPVPQGSGGVEPLATDGTDPGVALPRRGSVYRLYRAFFLRDPDLAGLIHWEARHHLSGIDLWRVAERFATSSEFRRRYGALTDAGFVDLVYRNVFDRPPDGGGQAYWLDRLAGGLGRGAMMVGFSESPEMQRRTRSAAGHLIAPAPDPPVDPLPDHDDWLGWLDLHRDGAGLSTLAENPVWSEGAEAHARYAVRNQELTHDQDPLLPLSSPEGQAAAEASNLFGGLAPLTHQQTISGWLNSPGHAAWMLNPDWFATGFGEFHRPSESGPLRWVAVLDVLRGTTEPAQVPDLVQFPGHGQTVHHRPNHLYVIFPVPVTGPYEAEVFVDGEAITAEAERVQFGNYPASTVAISLDRHLPVGATVVAEVSAASQDTSWTFDVGAIPPTAPTVSSTTTPSGLIALRLGSADDAGDDEHPLHRVVELVQDGELVERAVADADTELVFLHGGPPAPGLQVLTWATNGVGTSPEREFAY